MGDCLESTTAHKGQLLLSEKELLEKRKLLFFLFHGSPEEQRVIDERGVLIRIKRCLFSYSNEVKSFELLGEFKTERFVFLSEPFTKMNATFLVDNFLPSFGFLKKDFLIKVNLSGGGPMDPPNDMHKLLEVHQLTCLLGNHYTQLIKCIKAIGVCDNGDALLQVDKHSAMLAKLYALVQADVVADAQVRSELITVLRRCVPAYQLVGNENSVEVVLPRLREAELLVQRAIVVVGSAQWFMRYQALVWLREIEGEYAFASKMMSEQRDMLHNHYQGRASIALLGEGYYHLPVAVARKLLCIDETGKEVKANEAGFRAVAAVDGVYYKPNSKAEVPICHGKEYAVSSLIQLIAGQSLAAAPSTLLSISNVPIQGQGEEEQAVMTGNLVQGGLTITGMCFKDFIECRETLRSWQSQLSMDAMVVLLQDVRENFAHALAVAKQQYPDVFGVFDLSVEANRMALSEELRNAFEQVIAGKAVEERLCDIANSSGRPVANRRNAFRSLFESFLSAGGAVDDLCALLGVLHQYPALMARQEIGGLLQQFKHAKQLFKLLPNMPLETALMVVPQLLTTHYLDTEAMSSLWLGLLLTLPCDAKFDNFMLQLDYGEDKQLQCCRIVAIDNEYSLQMPFRINEHGQLSLELRNLLLMLPDLMDLPIHPTVRQHCLSMTSEGGGYLTWLSLLAKRDSDYQQWSTQGIVSQKALKAIDIPVQLPEQVWEFIKTQWQVLHNVLQSNAKVTLGQCFAQLYPLVDSAYQGLSQLDSPLPGPLAAEFNLYQFIKLGGSCPIQRLLKEWPVELEQGQCADDTSPFVSANQQMINEVRQLDWDMIPTDAQWPWVEALALVPTFRLADWQGVTQKDIKPRLQEWLQKAVVRACPFVAQRLLDLGADFNTSDGSNSIVLQQLFMKELYKCTLQGKNTYTALQIVATEGYTFMQYQLGQLCYQGNGIGRDIGAALKWIQLSANAGYKPAKQQLQSWQESNLELEVIPSQDSPWQILKAQRQVKKQKSVTEDKMIFSELLVTSDNESVAIGVDNIADAPIKDDLVLSSSSNISQLQASLNAHQLVQLLGTWHAELIACVNALGVFSVDTDALLQVDKHSGALAELYALVKQSVTVDDHVYSVLMKTLGNCMPVYQIVGSDDSVEVVLPRLESVALLVQQAIEIVGCAHWLMRHQVLGQLRVIESEYAVASKLIAESGDVALHCYQGRASVAVLGEGYYHLPVTVARQLLCVDETGKEVKANQAGSHAVAALNGVHYKPNSKAEFPINPGKEVAVSSLIQLIAGQSLAAAPSTLLSVSNVLIQGQGEEEQAVMTGNLVQGGLTITGMCFKDFIECREALRSWQSRLSSQEIISLLEDNQHGLLGALKIAQIHFPDLFETYDDLGQECEALRQAFEKLCNDKAVEARLIDIQSVLGKADHNRPSKFWAECCEPYLRCGGALADMRVVVGVLYQYPSLMAGQRISDLQQQLPHTKRIFKLFPKTRLNSALQIINELLTSTYLDTEAFSALWVGLLLTLPCDSKFDNFMLQLDYGDDKQLQQCRIVTIDNDVSLKMPFSINEVGQLSLELKNLLIVLPELMNLPIHPAVHKHCLSMSSEGWYLTWLSLLAKGDSDYQQWLAQETVSEKALKAIDIPVQLPEQIWEFIRVQWCLLHDILQHNAGVTLGQCFTQLYPLVNKAYQGLIQLDSPLSGPLAAEFNLYQFFKTGGSCPVERLLTAWSVELEQGQCADDTSPFISASQQMISEVRQLDWMQIPQLQQWPLVEALSLLPGLTLADWQGTTKESIRPHVQGWFREAVTRGRPFVVKRLLDLGAQVSLPDESENTALHQLCASYLNYPDSETVRLMSYVLLGHHTCQPNQYNASGYTPLLQWVNVTPEPERLTPAQSDSALELLEALIGFGANLEAKDMFKHGTTLDKTMKQGREKWHWFEVLIDKGAGVHANGEMIVKHVHESGVLAERPALQAVLKHLARINLSVAWGLSQQVWQVASGKQSKSAVVVYGSHCGNVVLPPAIAEKLLTNKRVFDVKGQSADYGRRIVKKIEYDKAKWHVKENPEMPGVEVAVGTFSRLLFGEHTAPNELFSFFDAKGVAYPVLISQTVLGANLQTILNDAKKGRTNEVLQQLHPQYTSEQIVLAMLVHPEDGKPDNYQVLPMKISRADSKVITQYRLIGIDNDHAFVKPITMEKGHRMLQVKTVLFCLDNMRQPVHPAVRQRLLHLNPVTFLESWLDQLIAYHEGSMKLFDKKARQRLFKVKTDLKQLARKVALREVRERLPVVVTVPFRDGAITEMWDRLVRLQQVLRDNPMITHLQLLKEITPSLGIVYEEAFEVHEESLEVANRFHEVANTHYSTAIAGHYATLTTSRQALQVAGFSDKEQNALLEDGDKGSSFTPRHALMKLRQGVEQKAKLATFVDKLAKSDPSVLRQILSEQVKEDAVNRLDFGQMLIGGSKQPDIAKAKFNIKVDYRRTNRFSHVIHLPLCCNNR